MVASGTHLPCTGNASAWASPVLEERHAIMNPFGHGLHLDRAAFDEMLRDTVRHKEGSRLSLIKGRFKGIGKDSQKLWAIRADVDGETRTFLAKWVVDATGRKASLATKVSSRDTVKSYRVWAHHTQLGANIITPNPLLAFYAVFTGLPDSEGDHDRRTLIEATADGWFYSSLVSRSPCTRIVVFHTLPSHPSAKRARRRDGFLDLIHASSTNISKIIDTNDYNIAAGYPRCTAAGSSYLDKACNDKDGWIVVGDAALAFDPLSSQGMMTALEMGFYIGAILATRIEDGDKETGFDDDVEGMYRTIREEYESHRSYYYGIVERFKHEEFWNNVTSPVHVAVH